MIPKGCTRLSEVVAHYYLSVNAMTKRMQVREDKLPYGGRQ